MKQFHITGTRRGLGHALAKKYGNCVHLELCDVFINCKHDAFQQVDLLYYAASLEKDIKIINIGSNSPDQSKSYPHRYQVEKFALDKANEQLFYQGVDTTILRFGYIDTPRVAEVKAEKMSVDYCISVIEWIIEQPHRIKDLTVVP